MGSCRRFDRRRKCAVCADWQWWPMVSKSLPPAHLNDHGQTVIYAARNTERRSQAVTGSALAPLTARQFELLVAIEGWTAAHGAPPALTDLARAVGLASVATVSAHLERLQAKGYIHRDAGAHYGLTVLVPSSGVVISAARPIRKAAARELSTAELEAELRRRGRRIG